MAAVPSVVALENQLHDLKSHNLKKKNITQKVLFSFFFSKSGKIPFYNMILITPCDKRMFLHHGLPIAPVLECIWREGSPGGEVGHWVLRRTNAEARDGKGPHADCISVTVFDCHLFRIFSVLRRQLNKCILDTIFNPFGIF